MSYNTGNSDPPSPSPGCLMAALKCPNPSCPFLFDPTQVPPGAVLACPRCGMRFTLGATAAAPTAAPPPDEPAARPTRDRPRRAIQRGGLGVLTTIAAVGGAVLVIGAIVVVVGGAMMAKRDIGGGGADGGGKTTEFVKPEYNFAFTPPAAPWERDPATQAALGATAFAYRRAEPPEAWVALSVSDYKDRNPLPHELQEKMAEHLNRAFLNVPETLEVEPTKWAGKDTWRGRFRGVRKDTELVCAGEAFALADKGVGYWFYTWSAERDYDAQVPDLGAVRDRFRLLAWRESWAPTTGSRVVFPRKGTPKVPYQLGTHDKNWTERPGVAPTDVRPQADLALIGTAVTRTRGDRPPTAELVVLVFDDPGDPAAVAAREVRKWYTREPETYGEFTVTEQTADPEGDPSPGDGEPGTPVTRFAVTVVDPNVSKSVEKLVVFSAVRVGGKVVVAEAHCQLSQRKVWERKLIQFVGSLRAGQ